MIDLIFKGTHPLAVAYKCEYVKDDGTINPTYTVVSPNPTALPFTVSNKPDGKYKCRITPIKSDGTFCQVAEYTTSGCGDVLSFSAVKSGSNIVITISVPPGIAQANVNIKYPNAGIYNQNHSTGSGTISIALPPGVYGDFEVKVRTVCNAAEAFYGDYTPTIIVNVADANACPQIKGVVVSGLTATEVDIIGTPPDVVTNVTGYTLRLTPIGGGAVVSVNSGTPVFNNVVIQPSTQYRIEVITNCTIGGPTTFDAGVFTSPAAATNSTLVNSGSSTASPFLVTVDGSVVHNGSTHGPGVTTSFNVADIAGVDVVLTTGGMVAGSATLLSDAVSTPGVVSGNTVLFAGVNIVNGMVITYS